MDSNQQKVSWALLVVDRMKQLRTEGFRFADQEVVISMALRTEYSRGLFARITTQEKSLTCR